MSYFSKKIIFEKFHFSPRFFDLKYFSSELSRRFLKFYFHHYFFLFFTYQKQFSIEETMVLSTKTRIHHSCYHKISVGSLEVTQRFLIIIGSARSRMFLRRLFLSSSTAGWFELFDIFERFRIKKIAIDFPDTGSRCASTNFERTCFLSSHRKGFERL